MGNDIIAPLYQAEGKTVTTSSCYSDARCGDNLVDGLFYFNVGEGAMDWLVTAPVPAVQECGTPVYEWHDYVIDTAKGHDVGAALTGTVAECVAACCAGVPSMIPDTVLESADLSWSDGTTHEAGGSEGTVNGFWGGETTSVSSTVSVPAGATSAVLKLRYWAIDSWDWGETASVTVDGTHYIEVVNEETCPWSRDCDADFTSFAHYVEGDFTQLVPEVFAGGDHGSLGPGIQIVPSPPGLYFEAYDVEGLYDLPTLGTILDTVEDPVWNHWNPSVVHPALEQDVWYSSNSNPFENDIPTFNNVDTFYMRWRGQMFFEADGSYDFKTRSDDGSFVLINGAQIVNNDGWHGMQYAEGTVELTTGWHAITIAFYEGGGAYGIEVSWRASGNGGKLARLNASAILLNERPALFS